MQFKDIVGHNDIKRHLISTVKQGNIPHARLISGITGIGKLSMAIAYAQYLNCTNRGETDSCGECPTCRQISSLMHPDVHYSYPIYKSAKLKKRISDDYIAQWRNMITNTSYPSLEGWLVEIKNENAQPRIYVDDSVEIIRKLSFKNFSAKYKMLIMWMPELMNTECANKLLKIIEEPYPQTVIILVSDHPERILPTILSRTQLLSMRPIAESEIISHLVSTYSVGDIQAREVARIANGSYRKALEFMQQSEENKLYFDLFVDMMRNSYARKIKEMQRWSDTVSKLGRESIKRFLQYCQRMLRENYIYNTQIGSINYQTEQEKSFSVRFAPFINEKNVIEIMEEFSRSERDIAMNGNARIVLFDLSIRLILLLKR